MNAKTIEATSKFDTVKWLLAIGLLVAGVVGFNMLAEQSIVIRAGVVIVAVVLAIAMAGATAKGKNSWKFARESRTELRKVIWPTSNETVKTSVMVIIMVIILGALIWLLDLVINSFIIGPILG